jgi:hypothetical protein
MENKSSEAKRTLDVRDKCAIAFYLLIGFFDINYKHFESIFTDNSFAYKEFDNAFDRYRAYHAKLGKCPDEQQHICQFLMCAGIFKPKDCKALLENHSEKFKDTMRSSPYYIRATKNRQNFNDFVASGLVEIKQFFYWNQNTEIESQSLNDIIIVTSPSLKDPIPSNKTFPYYDFLKRHPWLLKSTVILDIIGFPREVYSDPRLGSKLDSAAGEDGEFVAKRPRMERTQTTSQTTALTTKEPLLFPKKHLPSESQLMDQLRQFVKSLPSTDLPTELTAESPSVPLARSIARPSLVSLARQSSVSSAGPLAKSSSVSLAGPLAKSSSVSSAGPLAKSSLVPSATLSVQSSMSTVPLAMPSVPLAMSSVSSARPSLVPSATLSVQSAMSTVPFAMPSAANDVQAAVMAKLVEQQPPLMRDYMIDILRRTPNLPIIPNMQLLSLPPRIPIEQLQLMDPLARAAYITETERIMHMNQLILEANKLLVGMIPINEAMRRLSGSF